MPMKETAARFLIYEGYRAIVPGREDFFYFAAIALRKMEQ